MYLHYALLAVGICTLGLGLFIVAKPDSMWRFTEWRNRAGGVATGERGPAWERNNRFLGIVAIVTGLSTVFGFWQFDQIVAEERARKERARQEQARNQAEPKSGPELFPSIRER